MTDSGRHVILGAGPLGVVLQARLEADGVDVSLWGVMGDPAYDMPGTEPQPVNGNDPAALSEVCADAAVVYLLLNAHYVDWYAFFPGRLMAAVTAAASVGAKLVYHDSIYVYGETDGPLTEDEPAAASTRKGRLRAAMTSSLMKAIDEGRVEGAVGRTADMYGPGALDSSFGSTLGQRHFYPLLEGRTVEVVGDADVPHAYAFVDDVAQGLAVLGREPRASGKVWHLPAAPARSHRELLGIAGERIDVPAKVRSSRVTSLVFKIFGRFQEDMGEVAEMLYLFERPLLVSHERFESAFGADPTPHGDALAHTLEWYRDHPQFRS